MGWDGAGNFSRSHNWQSDRDAGIDILASRHDEEDDNLSTGIASCLTKNGETKPTATFSPNANRSYDLGSTALRWRSGYFGTSLNFQSATAAGAHTVTFTDATTARSVVFPDAGGTVAFLSDLATLLPAGAMLDFAGSVVPTGYLACDGSAVSRTTYATLFAAISTVWGVGDGSTTFNLPDARRRVSVGSGGSGTATLANTLGSTGGAETHTLTTAEMPAHTHTEAGSNVATFDGGAGSNADTIDGGTRATGSTGGGGAHNNMQPSYVVTKIIKT